MENSGKAKPAKGGKAAPEGKGAGKPAAALPGSEEGKGGKGGPPRGPPPGVPKRWGKADSDAARAAAVADSRITPALVNLKIAPCDRLAPVDVPTAGIAAAVVRLCAALYTEGTARASYAYLAADETHLASAWLQALGEGIKGYKKPEGAVFAWHLNARITDWQKFFFAHGKQASIAVANVTRFVQSVVARVPATTPDEDAKSAVVAQLAAYEQERLAVAEGVAAAALGSAAGAAALKAGAVVAVWEPALTAAVVACLKAAKAASGGALTVNLVTAGGRGVTPLIAAGEEGATMSAVTALTNAGIAVASAPYATSAVSALQAADALLLGVGGAVLGDGALLAAAGAGGLVALAKSLGKPVLAAVETFKFSEVFAPDAAAVNVLGPAALVAAAGGAAVALAPAAEVKKAADTATAAEAGAASSGARQQGGQPRQAQAQGGKKGGAAGAAAPAPVIPFVSGGLLRQPGGDAYLPGGLLALFPGLSAEVLPPGAGPEVPRLPSLVGSWALVKGLALAAPAWDVVRPCEGMTLVTEVGALAPCDAPAVLQVFAGLEQAPQEEDEEEEEEEEAEEVLVAAEGEEEDSAKEQEEEEA